MRRHSSLGNRGRRRFREIRTQSLARRRSRGPSAGRTELEHPYLETWIRDHGTDASTRAQLRNHTDTPEIDAGSDSAGLLPSSSAVLVALEHVIDPTEPPAATTERRRPSVDFTRRVPSVSSSAAYLTARRDATRDSNADDTPRHGLPRCS